MRFPAKKNVSLPKSTARFPAKKGWHFPPPLSGCLGTPLPLSQGVYGWAGAYADVTNKFLGSIGYQIC